jgi:hypothetical protein
MIQERTAAAAEIVDRYEELREHALKLEPTAGLAVLVNHGVISWMALACDNRNSMDAPTCKNVRAINSRVTVTGRCSEIITLLANMVVSNQSVGVSYGR